MVPNPINAVQVVPRTNHVRLMPVPNPNLVFKQKSRESPTSILRSKCASFVIYFVFVYPPSIHSSPSNEWQDHVTAILEAHSHHGGTQNEGDSYHLPSDELQYPSQRRSSHPENHHPLYVIPSVSDSHDGRQTSPTRRQRRRVGTEDFTVLQDDHASPVRGGAAHGAKLSRTSMTSLSPLSESHVAGAKDERGQRRRSSSPLDSISSDSEEEVTDAVGQLSLNEDAQVRYHGKASGLHLLGIKDRVDARNEGGIWYVAFLCFWRK